MIASTRGIRALASSAISKEIMLSIRPIRPVHVLEILSHSQLEFPISDVSDPFAA